MSESPLRLRSGPGETFGVLGLLVAGQRLDVVGRTPSGDWLRVRAGQQGEGWVFAGYVDLNLSLSAIPVVAAPPTPTAPATATPLPPTATPSPTPTTLATAIATAMMTPTPIPAAPTTPVPVATAVPPTATPLPPTPTPTPLPPPTATPLPPPPPPTATPIPPPLQVGFTPRYGGVAYGEATYYGIGDGFNGQLTASGEIFNTYDLTAAHLSLPFGTLVRVSNVNDFRSVVVRINDRGPYGVPGLIIDLSYAAARQIGVSGRTQVKIEW